MIRNFKPPPPPTCPHPPHRHPPRTVSRVHHPRPRPTLPTTHPLHAPPTLLAPPDARAHSQNPDKSKTMTNNFLYLCFSPSPPPPHPTVHYISKWPAQNKQPVNPPVVKHPANNWPPKPPVNPPRPPAVSKNPTDTAPVLLPFVKSADTKNPRNS